MYAPVERTDPYRMTKKDTLHPQTSLQHEAIFQFFTRQSLDDGGSSPFFLFRLQNPATRHGRPGSENAFFVGKCQYLFPAHRPF